ncbi:MAG TPA: hemolysin family protein [Blastocatellia bacterium]|nr:hemolysin family protein [Blastocatellia bacterium]HMX27113.1 hemolysin family protein [Blastocatellia bacterium]HMZ18732.1 hemolysin family protein [Blastocatellia bacterium]HNG29011.1 hemolysin family protein [Blastocatellia bacterium]
MSQITFEIFAIFVLLIANGIFAMSEMAIVSARKARLKQRADQGDARALAALALAESPGPFLSTVQIGITLVGILAGAFGGSRIAERLAPSLSGLPYVGAYAETVAFVLVVIVITYFSLVIGELIPKRLALHSAESIAVRMASPMGKLSKFVSPIVVLLDRSTDGLLRLFGLRESAEPPVTEDEIKILIEQGIHAGVFVETERDLVERIFHLADRRVSELMVPRTSMVWLNIDDSPEEINAVISGSPHSRFPVAQETPDNILGVVQIKNLWAQGLTRTPLNLKAALEKPLFLPEGTHAFRALEAFRQSRTQVALVVDEHGGVEGLVTLNDILEAIVGDLPNPGETVEPLYRQREDGSYLIDGALDVDGFKKLFTLKYLPGEQDDWYQTVGGFVMTHLGKIPRAGDCFEWGGLKIEVLDMDRNRVDKLLVQQLPPVENSE